MVASTSFGSRGTVPWPPTSTPLKAGTGQSWIAIGRHADHANQHSGANRMSITAGDLPGMNLPIDEIKW